MKPDDFRLQKTNSSLLLFDFDGTLADSFEATLAVGNELAKKYGYQTLTAAEAAEMRNRGVRQILRDADLPLRRLPGWIREFRKQLARAVPEMQPLPGIHEALLRLREKETEFGIVTSNSLENVQLFLANNGWSSWFPHLECGSGLFGKHRLIQRVVRRTGQIPKHVFYIGDEERDIESARRAGVRSVAVTWGFNSRQILEQNRPDHLLDHPQELEELA